MSKDETIEALTAERDDAVRGMTSALLLVCDLRWALGDRGGRMQPELIEFARQMRQSADRYQLLRRGQHWSVIDGIGDTLRGEPLDAAIDAKLALHNDEVQRRP